MVLLFFMLKNLILLLSENSLPSYQNGARSYDTASTKTSISWLGTGNLVYNFADWNHNCDEQHDFDYQAFLTVDQMKIKFERIFALKFLSKRDLCHGT